MPAMMRYLDDGQWKSHLIPLIAFVMSTYQFTVGWVGEPIAEIHRPTHLAFILVILYVDRILKNPRGWTGPGSLLSMGAAAIGVGAAAYLVANSEYVGQRMVYVTAVTPAELLFGGALIVVLLDAAWRAVGWLLAAVAAVFVLYTQLGPYLAPPFWHNGYEFARVVEHAYLTVDGIWTTPLAVSAGNVFLFVLFGATLLSSGAGRFFTDLANALTGRQVGGAAKTAVVGSAFMGTLSGSAAANVVTTGTLTIAAMRAGGYRKSFAAGVEACASCGGQITPPVMGAAAFIMVELIGVPYTTIITIAAVPAALYFLACFITVDLEARRLGLRPGVDQDFPKVWQVVKERGYLLLSIVAMLYYLFQGYPPQTAAFWSIVYLICLVVIFDAEGRRTWVLALVPVAFAGWLLYWGFQMIPALTGALLTAAAVMLTIDGGVRSRFVRIIWNAWIEAPRMMIPVAVATAVGGLIIGMVTLTGLGERLSAVVLWAGQGSLLLTLLFTMIAAVVMGMGMPIAGAYVVLAALLAPALEEMLVPVYTAAYGLDAGAAVTLALLSSHLFIIYSASWANLTPPVAIAVYAAAAIADSEPWETCVQALKVGLPIFILPFLFVYGPELLFQFELTRIAYTTATAAMGIFAFGMGSIGWMLAPLGVPARLCAIGTGVLLMAPEVASDAAGAVLLVLLLTRQYRRHRFRPSEADPSSRDTNRLPHPGGGPA